MTIKAAHRLPLLSLVIPLLLLPRLAGAQTRRAEMRVPHVRADMLVSTEWLGRHLNNPGLVVLHVGEKRSDYDAGHIPGARFLAVSDIAVTRSGVLYELPPAAELQQALEKAGVGDGARVILYGDWQGLLAARAWFTLDYLGHGDRAALLDGGLEKWRVENRPISKEAPAVTPAKFAPHVNPDVLVTLPVMRDLSWELVNNNNESFVLADARPADEYAGTKLSHDSARPGHIPGALSLHWKRTLESEGDPEILPPFELRKVFAEAGITGNKKVVSYCVTGVQGSFIYFTAKYLGYDAALYDGSFSEWSNAPGTAVESGMSAK